MFLSLSSYTIYKKSELSLESKLRMIRISKNKDELKLLQMPKTGLTI